MIDFGKHENFTKTKFTPCQKIISKKSENDTDAVAEEWRAIRW